MDVCCVGCIPWEDSEPRHGGADRTKLIRFLGVRVPSASGGLVSLASLGDAWDRVLFLIIAI